MNLCLLRGVQSALTLSQTRARCKEIPTRTTIKIAAGPGCSYRSPAGRDERRGRRAPGPGFEKSSAVVTQGGRSFGPQLVPQRRRQTTRGKDVQECFLNVYER